MAAIAISRLGPVLVGLLAAFVALVLHELGHAIAGRTVGFRFAMFGVGPVCIAGRGRRWLIRVLPPSLWGPFALSIPTSIEHLAARMALFTAGGPIASLLVAAASAMGAQLLAHGFARTFASWLALLSACVFVATAQPFGSAAGLPSDGGRLRSWMRRDPESRVTTALIALESLAAAGVRPRDWDPALVTQASEIRQPPAFVLSASTLRLRRALDAGDDAAAATEVARLLATFPSVPRWLRSDAACEAACWCALHHDLPAARRLLDDARGVLAAPHRVARAEAAVRLAEGDRDGARLALTRARASLDRGMVVPSALDLALIERLARALEPGRESTPIPPC